MQHRAKKFWWLAVTLVVVGVIGWWVFGSKSAGAAAKYKAELRAKGEKISFAELGFPKPPEDGRSLMRLTNAVSRMSRTGVNFGHLTSPRPTGPGRQRVLWRGDSLSPDFSTNVVPWAELSASLAAVSNELDSIRAAAEQPARYYQTDPAGYVTNFLGVMKYPFVEMRSAAQCLYVDGIEALYTGDLRRARQDQHALIQLAEFNREDPTLVAAMIRVAIVGLDLQLSWQAWQHPNWIEADLVAMQRDWERVDLLEAVECGFTGERAFTELAFTTTRQRGLGWMRQATTLGGIPKPWESVRDAFLGLLWNADEDELLALRQHQTTLEAIRALRAGGGWTNADAAFKAAYQAFDKAVGKTQGLNRFRFQLSAMVIPNGTKAVQVGVRHETQRRLTVTALALKRYQLSHHRLPEQLAELVPEFLVAVPVDPMVARPLRYRRENDSEFVLYSVGEDGRDDGGNTTPTTKTGAYEIWSGLDAVWPVPAD